MKSTVILFLSFILFVNSESFSQSGWTVQNSGTTYALCEMSFVDINTGFAAGGNQNHLLIIKTTNGGGLWTTNYESMDPALLSIKFYNSNTGYAVGGYYPNSVIMKTTNQGLSWVEQYNPTTGAIYSISIINADTVYCAAGYGSILKTTNGGINWNSIQTSISDHFESIQFLNSSTGYAVARGGQIMKTTNSGNQWFVSYNCGSWLISVNFVNVNTGYTVGRVGKILFTNNGGSSWTLQPSGTDNYLNEVLFTNQNTGYIIGDTGKVLITNNSGSNWYSQATGISNNLTSVFFLNENTGYICGYNGAIIKTTSGGNSFVVPSLVYPPNNSSNIPLTPALTWLSNPPALHYHVQVSKLSNFSAIEDSATVITTQRTIPNGKLTTGTTYFWRVNATNEFGTGSWSSVWSFGTVPVGINQINTEIPEKYFLHTNFPNPFNPVTRINFDIPRYSLVTIKVYSVVGKEVETIISESLKPGVYSVNYDAGNLAAGIYFYRLTSDKFSQTRKMALIK